MFAEEEYRRQALGAILVVLHYEDAKLGGAGFEEEEVGDEGIRERGEQPRPELAARR